MIRQERRRLAHLFGLLVAAGCSTKDMPADATAPTDTTVPDDVGTIADATVDVPPDEGEDAYCKMVTVTVLDAGPTDGDAEADPPCEYSFPCGLTDGTVVVGCDLYAPGSGPLDARAFGCWLQEGHGCSDGQAVPAAPTVIDCRDCLGGAGRATSGAEPLERVRARSDLAAWFAKMAHDEAVSIYSFERFERELRRHRAPRELLRAARRARRDEVRHAKMMSAHAKKLGADLRAPRIRKSKRARSLEAIARENAIEGCVRETFAALLATWQAAHAPDEFRATFEKIAADETRHAALAHAAARWMDGRLTAKARARVRAARVRAAESIAPVVRRFFGDEDVVHVALAKTLRGDAHEA